MLPRPTLDDVTRRSNTIAGAKPSDWTCWGNVLESHPAASPAQPGSSPSGRQPVPTVRSRGGRPRSGLLRPVSTSGPDQAPDQCRRSICVRPYGRSSRTPAAAGFHVQLLATRRQEDFSTSADRTPAELPAASAPPSRCRWSRSRPHRRRTDRPRSGPEPDAVGHRTGVTVDGGRTWAAARSTSDPAQRSSPDRAGRGVPSRWASNAGPANARSIGNRWSSNMPTSSANGLGQQPVGVGILGQLQIRAHPFTVGGGRGRAPHAPVRASEVLAGSPAASPRTLR